MERNYTSVSEHIYASESWSSTKSVYMEPYDFEIFDFVRAHTFVRELRPYVGVAAVAYLLAVFWGQAYMKSRPAYQLRGPLILWNVTLAIYSMVTFLRCWPEMWFILSQPNGFYLTLCSRKFHSFPTAFWCFTFFLSKLVEFGDTAFIVLRKQKLIFLHWYHHVATFTLTYILLEAYDPASKYAVIINAFVHSWMYSYYALRALKVPIPNIVAKYITRLQILQMLILLGINIYSLYLMEKGIPCNRNRTCIYSSFAATGTFLILFGNFFIQRYLTTTSKHNNKSD